MGKITIVVTAVTSLLAMIAVMFKLYEDPFVLYDNRIFESMFLQTKTIKLDSRKGDMFIVIDRSESFWDSSIFYNLNFNNFIVKGIESLKNYHGDYKYYYKGVTLHLRKDFEGIGGLTITTNGSVRFVDNSSDSGEICQQNGYLTRPWNLDALPECAKPYLGVSEFSKKDENYTYIRR